MAKLNGLNYKTGLKKTQPADKPIIKNVLVVP